MQDVVGEGCQRNSARSGFDRESTRIIPFLVLQWNEIIVSAEEDLLMPTITDVSSLPANRDDTRRFLFLPFLNGLSTSIILPYGQKPLYDVSLLVRISRVYDSFVRRCEDETRRSVAVIRMDSTDDGSQIAEHSPQ